MPRELLDRLTGDVDELSEAARSLAEEAGLELGSTPKIVLDNRFSKRTDSEAMALLVQSMELFAAEGFDEAFFTGKDGQGRRFGG